MGKINELPMYSIGQHIRTGEVAAFIRVRCRSGTQQSLTCAALAKQFALSETALKTAFRRRYRIGLHAFIIKERMGYITELLETTNLPLKAIAAMSGYRERSNFCRDFTRHAGLTPLQWRLMKPMPQEAAGA